MFTWNQMLETGDRISDEALEERAQSIDPDDVTMIQYKSGTTGYPKGVMPTTQTRRNDSLQIRTETVGRALPNVEVTIVDTVTGEALPPGNRRISHHSQRQSPEVQAQETGNP